MSFRIISPKAVLPLAHYRSAHGDRAVAAFTGRYFVEQHRARAAAEAIGPMFNNLRAFNDPLAGVAVGIGKGRLCVSGEHLDHEFGPTISFPMDNGVLCSGMLSNPGTGQGMVYFLNMEDRYKAHISPLAGLAVAGTKTPLWHYYPAACLLELMKQYPAVRQLLEKKLLVLQFNGLPPVGIPAKGLSSSAAIEMATLITLVNLLKEVLPAGITRSMIAELGVKAENSFANCGRLDQHSSSAPEGHEGVLLDHWQIARGNWDKAYQFFDMPEQLLFGIADSGVAASTAGDGYRIRRLSGWAFAAMFFDALRTGPSSRLSQKFLLSDALRGQAPSLRDVYDFCSENGLDPLEEWKVNIKKNYVDATGPELLVFLDGLRFRGLTEKLLFDVNLKREEVLKMGPVFKPKYGDYILAEMARVRQVFELMGKGALKEVGELLVKTHYGMSEIYDAGTDANWKIVEILSDVEEVLGGRIVGAGFGGANMFAIEGETQEQRLAGFESARKALAAKGFTNVHMVPPGNGSAVVEME